MKARGLSIVLSLAAILAATSAFAEEVAGTWHGKLMGQLNLIVRIEKDGDAYKGVLESVDQGNAKIPIDAISASEDTLTLSVSAVKGRYSAKWDEAKKAWVGEWMQGQALPLELRRVDEAQAAAFGRKRPQVEAAHKGMAAFTSEAVSLHNAQTGVTLSGTYSAPKGNGPFPAVVLIAGSGPHTRDEVVAGHEIFLVLAEALNRAGIAVLRYDKRGVGQSTGDYASATTTDFATDAQAAADWLHARKDVKTVGLIGHSEGGIIAPMVAAKDRNIDFIVLMAGTGERGDRVLLQQQALIGKATAVPPAQLDYAMSLNRRLYEIVVSDRKDTTAALKTLIDAEVAAGRLTADRAEVILKEITQPWLTAFLRYDPAPVLKKVRVPVLALNGEKDMQVEPKANLGAIKVALSGNREVIVMELPGLNHLFQTAKTGSPTEYAEIEETISPVALKAMTDWISARKP